MAAADILKKHWGYDAFRGPQADAIDCVVAGDDVMVVMATGAGKSLCMQVPALVLGRPSFVVSPLISLMQDQVAALCAKGIRACYLGSAQSDDAVKADAWAGKYQLVYLTPELAAASAERLSALHTAVGVGLLAVDEAHCISEWGHDYRPEYLRVGELREALPGVPVVAVTATATPSVRREIARRLKMRPGRTRIFTTSFERPNLRFEVRRRPAPNALLPEIAAECRRACVDFGGCAIVYTMTTRHADEVAEQMRRCPTMKGLVVASYHAKLGGERRAEVHSSFVSGGVRVLVATVAYGMGIDKPDVRLVVHLGAPAALEAYFQQAGRAGRDGMPALCRLYWAPGDVTTADLVRGGCGDAIRAQVAGAGITAVQSYCMTTGCRAAELVNHFVDRKASAAMLMDVSGPCRGGCDSCDRIGRKQSADVTKEARLMLDTVRILNCRYGVGRAVDLLLGKPGPKKSKGAGDALLLHQAQVAGVLGAGSGRGEEWWRGLAGILVSIGALEYRTVPTCGGSKSFSAIAPGRLSSSLPSPLVLQLAPGMSGRPARPEALPKPEPLVDVSQWPLLAVAASKVVEAPCAASRVAAQRYARGASIDEIAAEVGAPRAKVLNQLVRCSRYDDATATRLRMEEVASSPLGDRGVVRAIVRAFERLGGCPGPSLARAFAGAVAELSDSDALLEMVPRLQYWHVLAVAVSAASVGPVKSV